jgi:hypothetical protein
MNWIRIQIELNPHENVVNVNYASYNWAPGYFINAIAFIYHYYQWKHTLNLIRGF